MNKKSEFMKGCENCRLLIAERGEIASRDFYAGKVEYSRAVGGSAELVKAYWDGYYFILASLGYAVERVEIS